jgi:hypothetical protein
VVDLIEVNCQYLPEVLWGKGKERLLDNPPSSGNPSPVPFQQQTEARRVAPPRGLNELRLGHGRCSPLWLLRFRASYKKMRETGEKFEERRID